MIYERKCVACDREFRTRCSDRYFCSRFCRVPLSGAGEPVKSFQTAGLAGLIKPDTDDVPTVGVSGRRRAKTCAPMTYQEIAARLGLSWQRVQQIEHGALRKLRERYPTRAKLMEAMH